MIDFLRGIIVGSIITILLFSFCAIAGGEILNDDIAESYVGCRVAIITVNGEIFTGIIMSVQNHKIYLFAYSYTISIYINEIKQITVYKGK